VRWTPASGAKSYAVTMRDPDAPSPRPFVHWLIWNLPDSVRALAGGEVPAGASQGRNGTGGIGYFGPRPPSGVHHYHLAVFALDTRLTLVAGADYEALTNAMKGHVIASGEVVATFAAPR
jgi:Raf kinase inhibitor-like YbhB/YbcL family protein